MEQILKKITMASNLLSHLRITGRTAIENILYVKSDYKQGDLPPEDGWMPYTDGTSVSGYDQHYWFKLNFKTPATPSYRYPVLISSTGYEGQRDTINPQSMVYINGQLTQAFDTNHTYVRLEPETDYEVFIYYYMGSVYKPCEFKLELAVLDIPTEQMYYDIFVPLQACRYVYTPNSYEYANTSECLNRACSMLELNYPFKEEYYKKIEETREFLKNEFYEKLCGTSPVTVNCIGHTHIDVAWLWTLAQTREKVQRSFATMTELMKYYPEYSFMMSQPQLLKYLSQVDPDLYAKIKSLAKEGRFEVEGAMWLEADCNLTSGESLVRQIIHGKRFLKDEFGVDSEILWLPDVFGYSAAIPQILNKSGIKHFVTSKISWNDTNTMPYDTFMWRGIDGSEILTDFITTQDYVRNGNFTNETTYVGMINPSMVAGCWNRYQQKAYNDEVMLIYGWGDGGGGPTADMLEQQRRLSYGLPGIPKTKMSSLKEHINNSEKKFYSSCEKLGKTPRWVGELYLEFHRGTYTSMAANKRFNRKSEMLMQRLEGLAVINNATTGNMYGGDDFKDMWETILLNQFHDIIPGSSIREVYEDSHKQYSKLTEKGERLIDDNLAAVAQAVCSDGGILVYNSLGFERADVISVNGKAYETELIPAYGWRVIKPCEKQSRIRINGTTAENDYFVLELDAAGRIKRLFDKRFDREVLCENGLANEVQIFEDMPLEYDNWELAPYYLEKCKVLNCDAEISVVDDGARRGFKITHKYQKSVITQYVYLYDSIDRVDIEYDIDWAEKKQLVKIAFPFDIHTEKATYDIQFGNVERATHSNTSWDKAKFEVCAHKWVDLSEGGYGVSLLNDCKYGFSVDNNVLKLTALKCGTYPNEVADQGHHEFRCAIYPHSGDFREGKTVRAAYSFNQPLEYREISANKGAALPEEFSLVKTDSKNVIIDTLKVSEDGRDTIIRIYDAHNCRSNVRLDFGVAVSGVQVCDLLENPIDELNVTDNGVSVKVGNYEIVTLRIKLAGKN